MRRHEYGVDGSGPFVPAAPRFWIVNDDEKLGIHICHVVRVVMEISSFGGLGAFCLDFSLAGDDSDPY